MIFPLLLSVCEAAGLPDGVVSFPLRRSSNSHSLSKRSSTDIDVANVGSLFSTTLKIGSNNQSVEVQIDTGSSDLWVMARSNPYCYNISSDIDQVQGSNPIGNQVECLQQAMFDPNSSSTFKTNHSTPFNTLYGDGTFANGTFGQDDVSFGSIRISDANFAVAYQTNSSFGVFGIGLPTDEATAVNVSDTNSFYPTYANLPLQMAQQGLISWYGYSLWLNDINANDGQLLFGGVDHAKYNGTLSTVPLISSGNGTVPNQLQIMLNGISIYQSDKSQQIVACQYPALLDSGTTLMLLPSPFLEAIAYSLNAANTESGFVVPCNIDGGLRFNFSGAEITVPFSEFFFPIGADDACVLAIQPSNDFLILGDAFLRSAYVVYDLQNLEVSIADTVYNQTSSQIEAWSSTVPGATKAPGYSDTDVFTTFATTTATGLRIPTVSGGQAELTSLGMSAAGGANGIPTATGTSSPSSSTSAHGGKKNGAGVVVPSVALIALAFLL